jgi:predicted RNA-binding protein with PIN domain
MTEASHEIDMTGDPERSAPRPRPVGGPAEPALPDSVRQRIIALVAEVLPSLGIDEVPLPLRPFARFTPMRRARLGGPQIATQVATDPLFRQRVAVRVVETSGAFGAAVAEGAPPPGSDPVLVAAVAYLARPVDWTELVAAATTTAEDDAAQAELRARNREVERLTEQLERARASARSDLDKVRAELAAARAEADEARARLREMAKALRAAEAEAKRSQDALSTERGRAAAAASAQDSELRRLRSRLVDAESELDNSRQATREGRAVDEARLWLLLETIGQAAQGLRRELALNPAAQLPADLVAASNADPGNSGQASRQTWAADGPARLDQLLMLPKAHLVVDGYNVTKTGFAEASLEQQRTRLINGLGWLAAQIGAEVTVVFDGAERLPVAPVAPRGVRVLFSRRGETADELIRRLVRAEPQGRPVIVVSSDKEVADGVRRAGAYPVTSAVLVQRLGRI